MSEIRELTRLEQLDFLIELLEAEKAQIEADIAAAEQERDSILNQKTLKLERKKDNEK